MKTQSTFIFNTLEDLWAFKTSAKLKSFEISASNKMLTFEGTQEQFDLAICTYRATKIDITREIRST